MSAPIAPARPDLAADPIVVAIGRRSRLSGRAGPLQREVQAALEADGWTVQREVPVDNRGDGRSGRVDLVADRDGVRVAIEIDRLSPRANSLFKLGRVHADRRFVMLRRACQPWVVGGGIVAFGFEVTT